MFSSVLDRVTTLTSKYFVIGAFVPVLVFGFINGVLLYSEFAWFRNWAKPQVWGAARVFDAVSVLVGLAVAAYVLWSLNGFLRQTLEGEVRQRDSGLLKWLRQMQLERFRNLRSKYFDARNSAARIRRGKQSWSQKLADHAELGRATATNNYDGETGNAAAALQRLRELRRGADAIPAAKLEEAIDKLAAELQANDVTVERGQNRLAEDRRDLLTLIDYAEDESSAREIALANELQSRFGSGTVPAATAFGNVALSMQSYSVTRYRLNFATFWTRLQPILQKEKEFFDGLQDAKVQLDFLVALVWLSALTTAVWLVILAIGQRSAVLFLAVGLLGPLVTRMCYVSAVENYVTFGELVRTAVDLYRFQLLDELHIARPLGLRDERVIWQGLQQVTSYGQEGVDLSYLPTRDPKV